MAAETTRYDQPMVELQQVSKRYGDVVALAAVDLAVRKGEFVTLLGPSGSGKTTLLNLIAGMRFWDCPKPTVSAVHGYCLAGALELALACDLTVADSTAIFGEPEVRFGSAIVALLVPWIAGPKFAKELLLTGADDISAQRALQMGLVNQVVDEGRALARAMQLAGAMTYVGELGWELYIPGEFALHGELVAGGQSLSAKDDAVPGERPGDDYPDRDPAAGNRRAARRAVQQPRRADRFREEESRQAELWNAGGRQHDAPWRRTAQATGGLRHARRLA